MSYLTDGGSSLTDSEGMRSYSPDDVSHDQYHHPGIIAVTVKKKDKPHRHPRPQPTQELTPPPSNQDIVISMDLLQELSPGNHPRKNVLQLNYKGQARPMLRSSFSSYLDRRRARCVTSSAGAIHAPHPPIPPAPQSSPRQDIHRVASGKTNMTNRYLHSSMSIII